MIKADDTICRLLVVEDDYSNYAYIRAIFPPEICIDWADCGKEALICYSSAIYDVLLVDIGLPDFPGTDFIKYVRKYDLSIPIIVTTGFVTSDREKLCLESGANDVFFKPFHPCDLRNRVFSYLPPINLI